MAAPTNITRLTAIDLGTLPATVTQNVRDSGTTYEVWYKFTAPADAVVSIWTRSQTFGGYQPAFDIYENDDVSTYLNFGISYVDANVPTYIPVTGGNTYYLDIDRRTGTVDPSPAVLMVTVSIPQASPVQAGDFLTNIEVDQDQEYPLCVLAGDADRTVRRYQQVATPAAVRGEDGLPHGEIGVIFANGNVAWGDQQYSNIKIYNRTFGLVATITNATDLGCMGISRRLQRMYATVAGSSGTHNTLTSYSSAGVSLNTWDVTVGLGGPFALGVNSDETIMYWSQGGTSAIKRWDLVNNVALADLVADTANYEIQDILVLEDDTIIALFHQETSTPRDVYAKHFSAAGATLQTYEFGDLWRNEFNPPRAGFALDSPDSFWVTLKPQGNSGTSIFQNVQVSDGTILTTRTHSNFLGGVSLNSEGYGGFAKSPSSTLSIFNSADEQTLQLIVNVRITFADGDGTQPLFKIGNGSDAEAYYPASTFTDAAAGTSFTQSIVLPAGESLKVQTIAATGATSDGSIYVSVFAPDSISTMGAEKAYALLVAPGSDNPTSGPEALEALRASGRLGTSYIVRLRRAPHLADEAQRIFYSKFQLDCQAGVGTVTAQGSDPIVELRWSNDGGFTWSGWRDLQIGKLGEYRFRAIAFALGHARDRVFEVRCSDPVTSAWLAAYLELEAGLN